jgi:antitoxin ParD1/3/4
VGTLTFDCPADTIVSSKQSERTMPTGRQQLVITLPPEMVDLVQRKVASGEYADESAVIAESPELLEDREEGIERWLREEIVPVCRAMEAYPSSGMSSSELLDSLEAARRDSRKPA